MDPDYIYLAPEPLTTSTFPQCTCGVTFRDRTELREHIGRWAIGVYFRDHLNDNGWEKIPEWPLRHMMVL